ncbi:MAG: SpoVR family protein [Firmicutes bacterium]|nr:SpoVR family protein [Bacillota bacterium]
MDDREMAALERAIGTLWDQAREFGLDPFPVHFEVVPAAILYEFGAYLLPGRFQHWTHGKAYWLMKTQYDYGLSKIYELVINSDPCYAFLLETNSLLQNKFVVAHVFGHSDFFKHNLWFQNTDRQILDVVSEHARRIRTYGQEEGDREVEAFLDAALSLSDHVDPYPRREPPASRRREEGRGRAGEGPSPYADLFPPEPEEAPPRAAGQGSAPGRDRRSGRGSAWEPARVPPEPERDLLLFLLEHADHLEEWQRDILAIVRGESLYFYPQMMTKIMNEGWATFWHSRILRAAGLSDEEFTEFARLHAAVTTPGGTRINPYHVGLRIWEDIEERYGRERLFEVRELENDASFLRLYLTEELCKELDLFLFQMEGEEWKVTSKDWERVRDALVDNLTTFGRPVIVVEDGDWRGRRELYLRHCYDGRPLDIPYAEKTLAYVERIWGRPVHLETVVQGRPLVLTCAEGKVRRG